MNATEQEFVEGYWQHTDLVSDGKDRHWVIVGTAALNPDGLRKALACRDSKPAAWSAAAEYTREHQRKVAELMEEIAWADDKAPFVRLFQDLSVPLKEYDVPVRLLNRLESALAELLKGVRQ